MKKYKERKMKIDKVNFLRNNYWIKENWNDDEIENIPNLTNKELDSLIDEIEENNKHDEYKSNYLVKVLGYADKTYKDYSIDNVVFTIKTFAHDSDILSIEKLNYGIHNPKLTTQWYYKLTKNNIIEGLVKIQDSSWANDVCDCFILTDSDSVEWKLFLPNSNITNEENEEFNTFSLNRIGSNKDITIKEEEIIRYLKAIL
jgi:hypothetical protein